MTTNGGSLRLPNSFKTDTTTRTSISDSSARHGTVVGSLTGGMYGIQLLDSNAYFFSLHSMV